MYLLLGVLVYQVLRSWVDKVTLYLSEIRCHLQKILVVDVVVEVHALFNDWFDFCVKLVHQLFVEGLFL